MADFLVAIRSGATDYDLQGRIRGTLDIPLCGEGAAAAERDAADLAAASAARPISALYAAHPSAKIEVTIRWSDGQST